MGLFELFVNLAVVLFAVVVLGGLAWALVVALL